METTEAVTIVTLFIPFLTVSSLSHTLLKDFTGCKVQLNLPWFSVTSKLMPVTYICNVAFFSHMKIQSNF